MDFERLRKSIVYVSRMAEGKNPVNNTLIETESILNNPNIIRCMFFIKDVLEEVYRNGGITANKNIYKTEPFSYSVLNNFTYIEDKTITKLFKQINEPIENTNMSKVKYTPVIKWLKSNGYISVEEVDGFNKKCSIVTEKGRNIGMYNEIRTSENTEYIAVMYGKEAQIFLVENLEKIINEASKL